MQAALWCQPYGAPVEEGIYNVLSRDVCTLDWSQEPKWIPLKGHLKIRTLC